MRSAFISVVYSRIQSTAPQQSCEGNVSILKDFLDLDLTIQYFLTSQYVVGCLVA